MKITRQQLHNVMQGRSALTPEMALRFEKAFGGSADMWLRMQTAYDLAPAREHQGKMSIPRIVGHPSHEPACVFNGKFRNIISPFHVTTKTVTMMNAV